MCRIDKDLWVNIAVVHFTGEAALWLQWTHSHVAAASWDKFMTMICEKFGWHEFEHLLC
jgi:hypothetical protein